jgi:hypothetical protein
MEYKEYLKTNHWIETRKEKTSKKRRCAVCGEIDNIDVHHLTYENIGNEKGDDLRKLCRRCHDLAHKLIPTLKRKDGVSYYDLTNNGRFILLIGAIKKELGLTNKNLFND